MGGCLSKTTGDSSKIFVYKGQDHVPSDVIHVSVHPSVKAINGIPFFFCRKLETLEFPSTLKTIEEGAIQRCDNLVSVDFNEGLEFIGAKSFFLCPKLDAIELPSTLKTIEESAFDGCENLVSVKFKEGLEIIRQRAFNRCSKVETIDLPSTLRTIEKQAFEECSNLVSVKFREGLEVIGFCAFASCSKLKAIHLPSSLKQIQEESFNDCLELEMVEIKEGVEKLGSKSFSGCVNLETLILPASLIEIGDAFIDCKILLNVKFPPEISKAKKESIQKNTILHQLLDYNYSLPFIKSFLKSCPTAISERNTLGQTPLHLCMTNQSSFEITRFVYSLWPEALYERNEIGKSPLHYWEEMGSDPQLGDLFSTEQSLKKMAPSLAYFLKDGKWIVIENPKLLRCQYIMLEVPESNDEMLGLVQHSSETMRNYFRKQLFTRELLFGKLLDEFANLINFDDKLVVQRAAALQALCGKEYLSKCLKRHVDLSVFSSSALWYQQEILKLVLRVYHEDQASNIPPGGFDFLLYHPSVIDDAKTGQHCLENGAKPVPSHKKNSFTALLNWIVDELCADDYMFEGPVLKPLQSLFNKIYIRRGQTKVSIIGDMARATLHIKKEVDLMNIIARIKNNTPDIDNFNSPDVIGVEEFMNQVFKMKKVPGTGIIPYRLKANSSQKGMKLPLLYNLNFFDMLPEYHRVGMTEMFVAFELQIGLESVIKSNRDNHMAYEHGRILKAQSLLKQYIEDTDNGNHSAEESLLPSSAIGVSQKQNDQDFKIMTAILEGNFSHDKLRALDDIELCGEGKSLGKPDRLCLNNKRLNRWINEGRAYILDHVSSLDPSLQYSVKSLLIHWDLTELQDSRFYVGLFAHVGPYMVSLGSRCIEILSETTTKLNIVKPNVNFETLERISPLPPGCITVSLICWGEPLRAIYRGQRGNETVRLLPVPWEQIRDKNYKGMKLTLHMYEKLE